MLSEISHIRLNKQISRDKWNENQIKTKTCHSWTVQVQHGTGVLWKSHKADASPRLPRLFAEFTLNKHTGNRLDLNY